jgi:hypothetical protein
VVEVHQKGFWESRSWSCSALPAQLRKPDLRQACGHRTANVTGKPITLLRDSIRHETCKMVEALVGR